MFFKQIVLNGEKKVIFASTRGFVSDDHTALVLQANHAVIGSKKSSFFISEGVFYKLRKAKYSKKNLFKWFFRDVLCKRLLVRSEAMKEYRDSKKLASLGINVSPVIGHAVFANVLSEYVCLLSLKYLNNHKTLRDFLAVCSNSKKAVLFAQIAADANKLFEHGLFVNDIHLDNFLVDGDSQVTWIDVQLKRVKQSHHREWLADYFIERLEISEDKFKNIISSHLLTNLEAPVERIQGKCHS